MKYTIQSTQYRLYVFNKSFKNYTNLADEESYITDVLGEGLCHWSWIGEEKVRVDIKTIVDRSINW